MSLFQGTVGPQVVLDGATVNLRTGRGADLIASELHGRFYEQNYRGNLYSGGMSALTSISNVTFTTGTLGATCTPIVGLWNPSTSGVNASVMQANLAITLTALTATGGGPFVWAVSTGNTALTLGSVPVNRKTFLAAGSQVKVFGGAALTGLANNLVVINGSPMFGGAPTNTSQTYTVAGIPQFLASVENLDGAFIVPPGGVLALLATTTPVAHSATSGIIWEEVAV
jgi:hypothetical protein